MLGLGILLGIVLVFFGPAYGQFKFMVIVRVMVIFGL